MTGPLARRYRRLLFCYPRTHRRDEMLATLIEAAPPGRTRPTAREAANLIGHGLRARLGRPASRTVAAWAVLAAIISGVFTAGFATRAGWQTAEPLPRTAQTRALLAEILPGHDFRYIEDAPALFTIYGGPLRWSAASDVIFGDGNEYSLAGVGGTVTGVPDQPPQATLDLVRQRLRDTGWTMYKPTVSDTYTTLFARRGNTTLTLEVHFEPTVYARRVITTLFGVAMGLWWGPTLLAAPLMAKHHVDEPHPSWHPMWEWLGQPAY